jgi:hypothetical protein
VQGVIHTLAAPGAAASLLLLTGAASPQEAPAFSTVESARGTGEIHLENATLAQVVEQSAAARPRTAAQPGEWQNSLQLVVAEPGAAPPEVAKQLQAETGKPPQIITRCLTAADANPLDPATLSETARSCVFPRLHVDGGKIDMAMECDMVGGKSRMTVSGTQSSTAYDLTMTQRLVFAGQSREMVTTARMRGVRQGECRK